MPIYLIDKIKQKNDGDFKLVDASDINWDIEIPSESIPDTVYTKEETNSAIAEAVAASGHLVRVVLGLDEQLPSTGQDNTIYMKPKDGSDTDTYDEYMWLNGSWELVGNSSVDLSNYLTKTDASSLYMAKSDMGEYTTDEEAQQILSEAKAYTDTEKIKYLPLSGGTMTGKITGIPNPTANTDAANKAYVDAVVSGTTPDNMLTPEDITTGTANGTISVKGNNIAVYGLGSAAYMDSSDFEITWHDII